MEAQRSNPKIHESLNVMCSLQRCHFGSLSFAWVHQRRMWVGWGAHSVNSRDCDLPVVLCVLRIQNCFERALSDGRFLYHRVPLDHRLPSQLHQNVEKHTVLLVGSRCAFAKYGSGRPKGRWCREATQPSQRRRTVSDTRHKRPEHSISSSSSSSSTDATQCGRDCASWRSPAGRRAIIRTKKNVLGKRNSGRFLWYRRSPIPHDLRQQDITAGGGPKHIASVGATLLLRQCRTST